MNDNEYVKFIRKELGSGFEVRHTDKSPGIAGKRELSGIDVTYNKEAKIFMIIDKSKEILLDEIRAWIKKKRDGQ